MKRRIILIAVTAVAIIALTAFTACVNTDLSGYGFPDGFEDALASFDFTRSENADVRVMSFNVLVSIESWGGTPVPPRAKMFLEILDKVKPDIIGAQEVCGDWHKVLEDNLGEEYKIIHPDINVFKENKSPVIYNSETMELIESGYQAYSEGDDNGCRAVTWGVFKIRETGKNVIVTNTHLDLIRPGKESQELEIMNKQTDELLAKIDALYDKYSCPVISCGDYNSMESAETPDYYGKLQGIFAAESIYKKLADSLDDLKYGENTNVICSDKNKAFVSTWDHIFAKGGAEAEKFGILDGDAFENVSDHFAIFADVKLK